MVAKYEKEIRQVIRDACYEDWMTEVEYDNILNTIMCTNCITYEEFSDQIEIGIDNGFSLEYQMDLMTKAFKELK